MKKRRGFNTKRKLAAKVDVAAQLPDWQACSYGGNPEHKRRRNDYDLTPVASPRPGKTLCDADREVPKHVAESLLRAGFERLMVSERLEGNWPQNVWAIDENGDAFEAQLENRERGIYHGYPMPIEDPFRAIVLEEWHRRA